jgi:glycosylphosphatidylinositol transamidase (GPIT) subunit GPI8
MAFKTGVTQAEALADAKNQAAWAKQQCQAAVTQLQSNTNVNQIFQIVDNTRAAIGMLQRDSAVPGIVAYAQSQYNDGTYDVATEFTNMVNALNAVVTWVVSNMPKDGSGFLLAHTINADGSRVARVFTPAQTAGLTTALNAAIAQIV